MLYDDITTNDMNLSRCCVYYLAIYDLAMGIILSVRQLLDVVHGAHRRNR